MVPSSPRKRHSRLVIVGVIAAIAVVVPCMSACSGSSSDGGTSAEGHAATITALATEFCQALRGCCDAAHFDYADTACVRAFGENQPFLHREWRENTFDDSGQVHKCAEAIRAHEMRCSPQTEPFDHEAYTDSDIHRACEAVVRGTLEPGESCANSFECASPAANVG